MRVTVSIERDDDDEAGETTSMGISAEGIPPLEVFALLMAGAEMVVYDHVYAEMIEHGGGAEEVAYAVPLRTRLLSIEQLVAQQLTPYTWVTLDMSGD